MENEERITTIITYIQNKQGCTRSDITRDFYGVISKKTIDKIVFDLIKEGRLEEKSESSHKLKKKLFVVQDNLLNIVHYELENFEIVFKKLIGIVSNKILEIKQSIKKNSKTNVNIFKTNISRPLLEIRIILSDLTDLYLTRILVFWHKKIHDSLTLEKLYNYVFKKLYNFRLFYINSLRNVLTEDFAWMVDQFTLNFSYATNRFLESTETFRKAGLEKESDPFFKSLWEMYKEIYSWAFPEPQLYKWNISHSDGYKKFIELCQNNPSQRSENYTVVDAEKYLKK
jgi:hypothetical protein